MVGIPHFLNIIPVSKCFAVHLLLFFVCFLPKNDRININAAMNKIMKSIYFIYFRFCGFVT